eukprot:177120-Prymnesium_polylepis.2
MATHCTTHVRHVLVSINQSAEKWPQQSSIVKVLHLKSKKAPSLPAAAIVARRQRQDRPGGIATKIRPA